MEQDLSIFFTTVAQAKDFSNRLSQVIGKMYETNFQLEKALSDAIGINKKDAMMTLLHDNKIPETAVADIKALFERLQRFIASLPVLSVTVAFEPTDETLKLISEWFLFNIKRQVLIDIVVDIKIIAGSVIHYNGKYKNYSILEPFQKILEEVLLQSTKTNLPTKENAVPTGTVAT